MEPSYNRAGPRNLFVLGCLYLAQGLPFGFFVQALPVILRERGASLPLIGGTALLALPWALKPLLGPRIDRSPSRRAWILPLQAANVALLAFASQLAPEESLAPLYALVMLTNAVAAAQDVATDALAVDLLPRGERGLGNGLQVAGYRVGMMLGGGAVLALVGLLGWTTGLLALAALLALSTFPLFFLVEPRRITAPAAPLARGLLEAARQPGALRWARALALYKAGEALATSMVRPMLVDAGLGLEDVASLLGVTGFGAGLLGSIAGGLLSRGSSRHRLLVGLGGAQLVGVALWALPALGHTSSLLLHAVCGVEHFLAGMATAALFTVMMDSCREEHAATDYAMQASVVVAATGAAAALGGVGAALLGYAGNVALALVLGAIGVLDLAAAKPPRALVTPSLA